MLLDINHGGYFSRNLRSFWLYWRPFCDWNVKCTIQLLFFKFYFYLRVKFDSLSCWFTSICFIIVIDLRLKSTLIFYLWRVPCMYSRAPANTYIWLLYCLYWIMCSVGSRSFFHNFLWMVLAVSSIDRGRRGIQRRPPSCRKSQTNFTTYAVSSSPHNDRNSNSQR